MECEALIKDHALIPGPSNFPSDFHMTSMNTAL